MPVYDPGDRYLASGFLYYDWGLSGATTLDASVSHTGKNKQVFLKSDFELSPTQTVLTQTTNFGTEPFNSNSDFFHVGFQHLFPVGQNFWIGPTAGWVFREANGYPLGTVQYVPEQTRWSVGTVMRYTMGKVTLNARVDHVWLNTGAIPAPGGSQVSLLSSTTCTEYWRPISALCTGWVFNTGTVQDSFSRTAEPSAFVSDWQGVVGLSIGF